ncbi:helix-turn-helix domain-containing protein [Rhodopseudomonas palustris]
MTTSSVKPMKAKEFNAALEGLGLNQSSAALMLGVSIRTTHGWANGAVIPNPVAVLLRTMVRHDLGAADVG